MKLTEKRARNIPTPTEGYTLEREAGSGLAVRVTANNVRSYVAVAWSKAKQRTVVLTVAAVGVVPINKARARARELCAEIALGRDPLGEMQEKIRTEKAARQAERDMREHTVRLLLDDYVDSLHKRGAPSAANIAYLVRSRMPVDMLDRPAPAVTASDIRTLLNKFAVRLEAAGRSKRHAGILRSVLHAAYNRALQNGAFGVQANPVASIKVEGSKSRAGERVLTMDELRTAWKDMQTTTGDSPTVGAAKAALRISLMLGGQRLKQLLRVTVADVDLDGRTIVLRDAKGGQATQETPKIHTLPVSDAVAAELQPLIASANGGLLFPFTAAWVLTVLRACRSDSANWARKDIRRTVATMLARSGVPPHIRERLASHGRDGIHSRHYDKWSYLPELRQTLATVESWFGINTPSKVVRLAEKRRKA